jgi:CubicO group peptidase (beta-lactamase class C family)
MRDLEELIDATAMAQTFSGVVRVDRRGVTEVSRAYGYADRAHQAPNTIETQFGTASATKTLTALTVMASVERNAIALSTTARSLLGDDLPEIADDVTVEHLLAHRSGIGDYLDEGELEDRTPYVLSVPVHRLVTADD